MSDRLIRPFRYLWRLPFLAVHVLLFLPATVIVINLGRHRRLPSGESLSSRAIRWWSTWILRVFGVVSSHVGEPLADPVLFVANHTSWLDIEVIKSEEVKVLLRCKIDELFRLSYATGPEHLTEHFLIDFFK